MERLRSVFRLVLISLLIASVFPSISSANEHEGSYELSPFTTGLGAGVVFFEGDEEFNSSFILDARLGYDVSDRVTLEAGLGWMPFLDARSSSSLDPETWHLDDSQGARGSFDVIYKLSAADKFRPHLAATAGTIYFNNSLRGGDHFSPFVGMGPGVSYALSKRVDVRADYRVVASFVDDETELNHHTLLSFMYRWGGAGSSDGSASGSERYTDPDGLRSGLKTIYFDYDKSTLKPEARARLESNAKFLQENDSVQVVLEGHCDERGTDEYNLALGGRRAQAALEYLKSLGVPEERMSTVSYGEERPAVAESNETAWAKNRRVEVIPE